jgi:glycosyltransferase involved in cell wall biosynthesis
MAFLSARNIKLNPSTAAANPGAVPPVGRQPRAALPQLRALQTGTAWFPEAGGGLERYYYDLFHALAATGVECTGIVTGTPAVTASTAGRVLAPATSGAPLLARWRAFRRAAAGSRATTRYDLAASHFALYAFPLLGALRDLPHVVHFHGPWAREAEVEGAGSLSTFLRFALERRVYSTARRLIVLSNAFRDVLCGPYRVDPALVRVIPGGVECDRFEIPQSRSDARAALGWPADRPIILSVRRLAHRMGLDDLIAATEQLRRRVPDALVLIAGKGRLATPLQSRIDSAKLQNHVRLLGFLPDGQLPLAYRAADLSVIPSTALEGFGLTAAESLAGGTPALVTPVGGLPEVVGPLSEQLVLPAAGADALAEVLTAALIGAMSLPSADECRRYARSTFDWPLVALRVRGVYNEATSN